MKKTFERLLALVERLTPNSQTAFAKSIGWAQPTFHGYLNEEGQLKIKLCLLEDILAVYGDRVSREWLYFGEGEMLISDERVVAKPPIPPAANEVAALQAEKDALKDKLIAAQDEIIHLQAQLARGRGGENELFSRHADGELTVPGARHDGPKG